MIEIEGALEETGDPLFDDPNKPLRIAQMVANEMHIAPRKKGAAPAPAPAAPAAPAQKKGILPAGGSRTVPATNTKPADVVEVSKITTQAELRAFNKKHGLPY